eukprot:snap_masked-scaffold_4-processed-gene-1.15-mRNA-1 protein AED:1.00 eAED:1.00 QI:0/0/0/0/1/1/2/0/73
MKYNVEVMLFALKTLERTGQKKTRHIVINKCPKNKILISLNNQYSSHIAQSRTKLKFLFYIKRQLYRLEKKRH